MKAEYRDLMESVMVFLICFISSLVILSIHAAYFTPYIDKDFMVDLSFFLTCITGIFVGYEWFAIKKEQKKK